MNRKQMWLIPILAIMSLAIPVEVFASESLRCGRHIITPSMRYGPSQYEVLKKCGEPTYRYGRSWTYERSGQATRVIEWDHNGNIMRIVRQPRYAG